MHKLGKKHPTSVKIGGGDVPINHDYRFCLEADSVLNSAKLKRDRPRQTLLFLYAMYDICDNHDDEPDPERLQAFQELFIEEIGEENISEAVMQAMLFLRCGEPIDPDKPPSTALIDFQHDAQRIEAALLRKGVDLQAIDYLHWYSFCGHISELPEGVTIGRLAYLRDRWNKGKLDKSEKEEIKRYGKQFYITSDEDEEAKKFWNSKLPD